MKKILPSAAGVVLLAVAVACSDDAPGGGPTPAPDPSDAGSVADSTPPTEAAAPDRCIGVETSIPSGEHGHPNAGADGGSGYGNVPFPTENPYSYEKAVLGKILFWDEQLSSDDTVACGTCHRPAAGGSDARGVKARHPGVDKMLGTADDAHGAPGIARCVVDPSGKVHRKADPAFGTNPQVTRRRPPSYLDAMFSPVLFWDGRAENAFRDPEHPDVVVIAAGGALESQAVKPPMGDSEMACEGRTWPMLTAKLAAVQPLALAREIPPPMMAALCKHRTYPELFRAAFGTPEITAARVAMAIATHERTLISNQTPRDRDVAGDTSAMTDAQKRGRDVFNVAGRCNRCHVAPNFGFTSAGANLFANLGFQSGAELTFDRGRAEFTGNDSDIGQFRTVSIRNVGLREAAGLLHDGKGDGATLEAVVRAYNTPPKRNGNVHPFMEPIGALGLTEAEIADLVDFLRNALTDPRVKNEQPPFDRPKLARE